MKKYLLSVLTVATAIAVNAEYKRLVFSSSDGTEQSIGLTNLNITFADGEMVATSEGEMVKMPLASMQSMEFSNEVVSNIPSISMAEERVTVYDTLGRRVGSYESSAAASAALPSGVYVFKTENGITYKKMINR